MRALDEILASKPSVRLASRQDILDVDFLRAFHDSTGRYPVAQRRLVHRGIPPELIHMAYYVEFETEEEMERFLSFRQPVGHNSP